MILLGNKHSNHREISITMVSYITSHFYLFSIMAQFSLYLAQLAFNFVIVDLIIMWPNMNKYEHNYNKHLFTLFCYVARYLLFYAWNDIAQDLIIIFIPLSSEQLVQFYVAPVFSSSVTSCRAIKVKTLLHKSRQNVNNDICLLY